MAVFRVEKTRNYTVMSNQHLWDKRLSLKAKGLLSLMLSLPEDWDYTTKGLARICKDGVDSICTTVRELEGTGYIVRKRERRADGTLGSIEYTILEQSRQADAPKRENPVQAEKSADAPKRAFPELVKPEQEKPAQLNIQEQSKEKQNTDVLTSFPSFWREDRSTQKDRMERRKIYSEQIRENISYDYLSNYTNADRERLDELVSLMLDTVCSTKSSIRVAGEELPAEVVRSRLLKLTGAHLLYVLDRINENTTEVRHVKPYLLTALYKKYADPKGKNAILTKRISIGLDGYRHQRNLNILVVGGSGSGKTRYFCKPGIMSANCSYLVIDPKGEMLRSTGRLLEQEKYDIKVFDLIHPQQSDGYNPFTYIRDEPDVLKLMDNLVKNTTPPKGASNDPFWEKAEIALDSALMLYLLSEAPKEEQNFEMLMFMLECARVMEEDEQYQSPLDLLFQALEEREPNHVAVREYKVYKQAAGVVCFKRLLNQSVRKSLKTYKPTILGKERIANEKKRENHAIV